MEQGYVGWTKCSKNVSFLAETIHICVNSGQKTSR